MSVAKITLFGMYKWMQDQGQDLFANLNVPAGMDADQLRDTILYNGAEFGMLYGDPVFVQGMIGIWSDKYHHTFERWINALKIEYNPLENYDRQETWSDAGDRSRSGSKNTSGSDTLSGIQDRNTSENTSRSDSQTETNSNTEDVNNGNSSDVKTSGIKSTENTVSAYDSTSYQPDNKSDEGSITNTKTDGSGNTTTVGVGNSISNSSGSEGKAGTDSTVTSNTHVTNQAGSEDETEQHSALHTGRAHGNIGVTTSQQMLLQEWEVARLNIYEEAANLFLMEFCIYVY